MKCTLERRQWTWVLLSSLALLVGCYGRPPARLQETISGRTMGTSFTVKYVPVADTASMLKISERVHLELESVNAQMSTYRQDSELMRFNEYSADDWFPVSAHTAQVVALALQFYSDSDGAFDVTVGPLVELWGFGAKSPPHKRPTDPQIEALLASVGSDKLEVRTDPPGLRKTVSGLRVDLSAIAKGHGVDRVAGVLEELGLENYFVEVGGEVIAKGVRHDGLAWQVGIERPDPQRREIDQIISLDNMALATSGDYRNFHTFDGQAFTHFIDPHSGRPVASSIASASVLAADCASADAIATTLMSAGLKKALQLIDRHQWSALLVVRVNDRLESIVSGQFRTLLPELNSELSEVKAEASQP
ncbi:MAG: FAD:protein FMN transferase [Pirellulaceae bacterium]|nr:FAD:protein FMN transferase [Pirellulaceae bacterium]